MKKYIEQAKKVINGRADCPEELLTTEECNGCFFFDFYNDVNEDGQRLYGCAFDDKMLEKANDFLNNIRTKKLERIIK